MNILGYSVFNELNINFNSPYQFLSAYNEIQLIRWSTFLNNQTNLS